jgi:hypothetical protein
LSLLLAGMSEKEIGYRLGISRNTVHVHVKFLYQRFAVSSRGELLQTVFFDHILAQVPLAAVPDDPAPNLVPKAEQPAAGPGITPLPKSLAKGVIQPVANPFAETQSQLSKAIYEISQLLNRINRVREFAVPAQSRVVPIVVRVDARLFARKGLSNMKRARPRKARNRGRAMEN